LPHFGFVYPIFEQAYNVSSRVVGTLIVVLPWDRYMINLLPDGVVCALYSLCPHFPRNETAVISQWFAVVILVSLE
jgi:hypothetical protein